MKKWNEISPFTGSSIGEDAPTNSAGSGSVAGLGVGPMGEPGVDPPPPHFGSGPRQRFQVHRSPRLSWQYSERRRKPEPSPLLKRIVALNPLPLPLILSCVSKSIVVLCAHGCE